MLERVANRFQKVVYLISRVLNFISMAAIIAVVLLVVVDVFMRAIFNDPIKGAHDVVVLGFSIIVFLSLAWCAATNDHLEIDIIFKRLPRTVKRILEVAMMFFSTVILGLISWQLLVQGMKLKGANAQTTILKIPTYPFVYLATLGFILLTLVFLIRFLHSLNNAVGEEELP